MKATVNGRTFDFDFVPASQGTRLVVFEDYEKVWDYIHILQTDFEILASFTSELFDEAIYAETLAEQLGIPYRFSDDADCEKCGKWQDYQEMIALDNFNYVCADCYTYQDAKEQIVSAIAGMAQN